MVRIEVIMAKILLVEDDKSLREIYGVRLMAEGYEIVSAGDGEEALAMAIKERPDLIVSDVMMPKISGFDMLDILRSTTETKNVKVIMMTALSSEDQRARGESLGADRYLVKSQVGIEDVVRTVHDVLGDGIPAPATAPVFPSATPASTPEPTAVDTTVAPAPTLPEPPVAPAPIEPPVIPEPVTAPEPVSIPAEPVQPTADPFAALPAQPGPVVDDAYAVPAPEPTPAPEVVPEPVAAPEPTPAPEPAPQAYIPPTPAPPVVPVAPVSAPEPVTPAPQPAPTSMPLPTAPFSTPAPASLGERVIAPLNETVDAPGVLDISSQMDQVLNTPGAVQSPGTPPNPTV